MFTINKVRKGLYHLQFDTKEEVTAHFLRYQEYYESPEFTGVPFQMMDYIRWYAQTQKDKKFSYFSDWSGFNLPIKVIMELYPNIPDPNDHDHLMYYIAKYLLRDSRSDTKLYLIGSSKEKDVLTHEVAHGLWQLEQDYHDEMVLMVRQLPDVVKKNLTTVLRKKGYSDEVMEDEFQAYLATGLIKGMRVPKAIQEQFKKVFDKYL